MRRPSEKRWYLTLKLYMLLGVLQVEASAFAAAQGVSQDRMVVRALDLAERALAPESLIVPADLDALAARAKTAEPPGRLALLYRRARASMAFRDRDFLERTAYDLRQAAAEAGNPAYVVLADAHAAYARSFTGEIHAALQKLENIASDGEGTEHWLARGTIAQFIAALAPVMGQVHRATKSLQDAFAVEIPRETALAHILQADLHLTLGLLDGGFGNAEAAVVEFERALEIAETQEVRIDRVAIVYNLAELLLQRDETEAARRLFAGLEAAARAVGRHKARFYATYGLMKAERDAGNPGASAAYAQRALEIYAPPPHFGAAIAQHQVSNMIALGQLRAAHRQLEIAQRFLQRWPDLAGTRYAIENMRLRSELAEAEARPEEALRLYRTYAQRRQDMAQSVFQQDVRALRARLERDLATARTERALAIREKSIARERLGLQRLWLFAAAGLVFAAVGAFIYQRRMARALDESRRRAEDANAAKSRFLANISHELRTPLNAIIGFSEMSASEMLGPIGNESYRNYAQAIHRSGRHLLAVINDILDISRVEAGRCELEEDEIDLIDAAQQAAEMVQPYLEAKGQELTIEGVESLPPVWADPRLMRQCLSNLLSNASKFTGDGQRLRIVGRLRPGDGVCLSVIDTGIGMRPKEAETALEPFGQVESVFSRVHEGTGLGLPIVKSFIELHGGRLDIESEPGRGTAVHLVLPLARVRERAEEPMRHPVAASA